MAATTITPREAEAVVDERIEAFGLNALPKVSVRTRADGNWLVRWTWHTAICPPMSMAEWQVWMERHIGSLDPDRLKTTEG